MPLHVIGAGHGRTGTLSLKFALEILGVGPCYHMKEVIANGEAHIESWIAAFEGRPVNWHALLNGYKSCVDYPAACFYKELMAAFPDAKVILTVRDGEAWFESASSTIWKVSCDFCVSFIFSLFPGYGRFSLLLNKMWLVYPFQDDFPNKKAVVQKFNLHNEQVRANQVTAMSVRFRNVASRYILGRYLGMSERFFQTSKAQS